MKNLSSIFTEKLILTVIFDSFFLSPLQALCSSVTMAHSREVQWKASEQMVVQLQAHARGFLFRQKLSERSHFLNTQLPAIITIQVRKHEMQPPTLLTASHKDGPTFCFILK